MPYYAQENQYTCGLACARMVIKHLTGIGYTEKNILQNINGFENGVGISLSNLVEYINSKVDTHKYKKFHGITKDKLMVNITFGIRLAKAASICGVQGDRKYGYAYDTKNHYIVVSAIAEDQSAVTVMDPWAGYVHEPQRGIFDLTDDQLMHGYLSTLVGMAY
ncbi:C39 family peptidase [Lachnospiraceae bacterium 47-T17]